MCYPKPGRVCEEETLLKKMCAVLLALLLPLCGALSEGITLKTVSTFAGTDAASDTYVELLRLWEEQTGNRVVDSSAPSDEAWKVSVLNDFAAGNEADVFFYFCQTSESALLTRKVVPVREINAAYPSLHLPENASCAEADGVVYAIPVRTFWEGLFVNTDLFDQYGLAYPTSWENLEKAVRVFNAHGIVPIAVSLSDVPHYIVELAILSSGDSASYRARPKTEEEVPQSWKDGMRLIHTLYEMGAFPKNVSATTEAETTRLFRDKRAAMQLDGSWFANGIPEENMDSTIVLPFPAYSGEADSSVCVGGVSMGFYVSRKAWGDSARRDAAVSLLAYLTTGENAAVLGGYTYSGRLMESAEAMVSGAGAMCGPIQDKMNIDARSLWFSEIPSVADGSVSPEEMWARVMAMDPFGE